MKMISRRDLWPAAIDNSNNVQQATTTIGKITRDFLIGTRSIVVEWECRIVCGPNCVRWGHVLQIMGTKTKDLGNELARALPLTINRKQTSYATAPKLVASNDGNIMRLPAPKLHRTVAPLARLIACHFNKPFFQLAFSSREALATKKKKKTEKASKSDAKMRIV